MKEKEEKGESNMYRSKNEIIESRLKKKRERNKSGWFLKKGYNAVLKVENTPSGRLLKMVKP